jgi:hypothetical protein
VELFEGKLEVGGSNSVPEHSLSVGNLISVGSITCEVGSAELNH